MHLSIDTNDKLTDLDRQLLGLLLGDAPAPAAPAAEAKPAPAKKAPAKKAAAKPAPEPEPEPEEDDEDLLGGDDAPTMADAVELATKLVSGGEAPRVKAALADAGVKRVSELAEDDIAGFVAALTD